MHIRPLSEGLQAKAISELNEDSSRREEDIKLLREWLQKQPHLTANQDEYFLLCFLRGCKFSLEQAKHKLDYFYTAKAMIPEYFKSRDPFSTDIQLVLNAGGFLPLPTPLGGPTGPRVYLFRWGAFDPSTMLYPVLIKVLYMILDILLQEDDNTVISGIHMIADFKNISGGYMMQITPTAMQKAYLGLQSSYPLRVKGMEMINLPSFFDALYGLIKPVLTKKFNERSRIYSENYAPRLYEQVPQSILPNEYGGSAGTLEELKDIWKRKVESYQQWFIKDEEFTCNEELRPKESTSAVFGPDGTFRRLTID